MRAFASIEALLALIAASAAFSAIMPMFNQAPLQPVYLFQLSQDFLEISMHNPETLDRIVEFSRGSESAKTFLEGKYSKLIMQLGDYCMRMEARNRKIEVNCKGKTKIQTSASRIVFDNQANDFFELRVTLGAYSR